MGAARIKAAGVRPRADPVRGTAPSSKGAVSPQDARVIAINSEQNGQGAGKGQDDGVKAQQHDLKQIAAAGALAKSKSTPVAENVLNYIADGLKAQRKASNGASGNDSSSGEGTEWSESDEEEPQKTPASGS